MDVSLLLPSTLHMRWPKYWSFSFSISSSNEHTGLISFRMDWLDLLAIEGTRKSLLQHHSSKASILWRSAFFMVQLLHPYMTTGKTIAMTRQTFVGKVMSLLLMLSCLGLFESFLSFFLEEFDEDEVLIVPWIFDRIRHQSQLVLEFSLLGNFDLWFSLLAGNWSVWKFYSS